MSKSKQAEAMQQGHQSHRAEAVFVGGLVLATCLSTAGLVHFKQVSTLPPVPFPSENPFSESKRVLGKALFWDEQLSHTNSMACGTCHIPQNAGTDPRLSAHPGFDGLFGTPDDATTSAGVIASDADNNYLPSILFALSEQTTDRAANPSLLAMYAPELFWDGRASSEFIDPDTGDVLIASGGALESQAIQPPLSDVEMAHTDRNWTQIAAKLQSAAPLALATDLPPDLATAVDAAAGSYSTLFEEAFGDGAITPARIAMAIATYERTLVPDQTPWDLFTLGNATAMTPAQIQGWEFLQTTDCVACHTPPMFTDHSFRNIALRPNNQDIGRMGVTGLAADRNKFKVPTLRNVGLKPTFMHTGQFTTLNQVLTFYAGPGAPINPNRDPLMPTPIPGAERGAVIDFLTNALTDPRVAQGLFPFDRPTLYSDRTNEHPVLIGTGIAGSGGIVPKIITEVPANIGNTEFKIGLHGALGGATAEVLISSQPPVGGVLIPEEVSGPIAVAGIGSGAGFATLHRPIPNNPALNGQSLYMQWVINDAAAAGGIARSPIAQFTLFCGTNACPTPCPGDIADDFGSLLPSGGPDGQVSFGDFLALLGLIGPCPGGTPGCTGDIADDFGSLPPSGGSDGQVSFGDFLALLGLIGPCP